MWDKISINFQNILSTVTLHRLWKHRLDRCHLRMEFSLQRNSNASSYIKNFGYNRFDQICSHTLPRACCLCNQIHRAISLGAFEFQVQSHYKVSIMLRELEWLELLTKGFMLFWFLYQKFWWKWNDGHFAKSIWQTANWRYKKQSIRMINQINFRNRPYRRFSALFNADIQPFTNEMTNLF